MQEVHKTWPFDGFTGGKTRIMSDILSWTHSNGADEGRWTHHGAIYFKPPEKENRFTLTSSVWDLCSAPFVWIIHVPTPSVPRSLSSGLCRIVKLNSAVKTSDLWRSHQFAVLQPRLRAAQCEQIYVHWKLEFSPHCTNNESAGGSVRGRKEEQNHWTRCLFGS